MTDNLAKLRAALENADWTGPDAMADMEAANEALAAVEREVAALAEEHDAKVNREEREEGERLDALDDGREIRDLGD